MKIDRLDLLPILAGLALFVGPETSVVKAQNKKKDCGKPMKLVVQPKFTGDDLTAWKDKSVSGRVSIVVNEDGEVIQARSTCRLTQRSRGGAPIRCKTCQV